MGKVPAFMFYPGDWMKDPELRSVSLEARGLCIDMLCLMWESNPRGYLMHSNGNEVTTKQLARMVGSSNDEVLSILKELEHCGVFSRTESGIIYSRRFVREEKIRVIRSEAGVKGGRPKGKAKRKQNPDFAYVSEKAKRKQIPVYVNENENEKVVKYENEVEAIYQAYPKHASKAQALKSIKKALKIISFHGLLRHVEEYAACELVKHLQDTKQDNFIPNPASWFNAEKWLDDRSAWMTPNNKSSLNQGGVRGQGRQNSGLPKLIQSDN